MLRTDRRRPARKLRLPVTDLPDNVAVDRRTDPGQVGAPDVDVVVVGAGQADLAAGRALQANRLRTLIIESSAQPGGSWSRYYDSLRLFSPARFSALPGLPLPGDADRYPTRGEITDYLQGYATRFSLPVRTGSRVDSTGWTGDRFQVSLADGDRLTARALIAASGGFGRPHLPEVPGLSSFSGTLLHAAGYRRPDPFTGQRVVVVGAGNSAVQIAVELAQVAEVTLASRRPIRFLPQRPLGVDLHYWAHWSGIETLPLHQLPTRPPGVIDDGRYAAAIAAGKPNRRPMFIRLTPTGVTWANGEEESIDAVILATGYRPNLDYLLGAGALDGHGQPVHCRGRSLTVPRLGYVGLPFQTGLASATIRGVGADARRVVGWLRHSITTKQAVPASCPVPAVATR